MRVLPLNCILLYCVTVKSYFTVLHCSFGPGPNKVLLSESTTCDVLTEEHFLLNCLYDDKDDPHLNFSLFLQAFPSHRSPEPQFQYLTNIFYISYIFLATTFLTCFTRFFAKCFLRVSRNFSARVDLSLITLSQLLPYLSKHHWHDDHHKHDE